MHTMSVNRPDAIDRPYANCPNLEPDMLKTEGREFKHVTGILKEKQN